MSEFIGYVRNCCGGSVRGTAITQADEHHTPERGAVRDRGVRSVPIEEPPRFRWFVPALGLLLAGYLFFSKTFAYLRVPGVPVFVGEWVLAIGVIEAFTVPSPWRGLLRSSRALQTALGFVAVCVVRLVRDFPTYHLDAVRDSAVGYYAAFAFLAAGVAVRESSFVPRLVGWYSALIPAFLLWAPFAVVLANTTALSSVVIPFLGVSVNSFKSGDFSVQVAMAVAFLWLSPDRMNGKAHRTRRATVAWSVVGLVILLVCGTQTRGGFVAGLAVLTIAFGCLPAGRRRRLTFSIMSCMFLALSMVGLLHLRISSLNREVSLQQVVLNVSSVVNRSEANQELDGTAQWREQLWKRARQDLLTSNAWVTGRGFGPVLGIVYGIDRPEDPQPVRSVHNSHLTIFVRVGVVGIGLWLLMWLTWCWSMVRCILRSPRGVRDPVVALGAWVLASALGILLNAYFDPALEGPQACVGLHVLFGLGVVLVRCPPGRWTVVR
jgi:hypothetical protein